jgi:hypothetical protein
MPENLMKLMTAFMEIGWLMPLIAVAEIAGGILFITNKYRALGAIIIFPVMIGILLTHIITGTIWTANSTCAAGNKPLGNY